MLVAYPINIAISIIDQTTRPTFELRPTALKIISALGDKKIIEHWIFNIICYLNVTFLLKSTKKHFSCEFTNFDFPSMACQSHELCRFWIYQCCCVCEPDVVDVDIICGVCRELLVYINLNNNWYSINTFGLIKAASDTIFEMIVTTYHEKPLVFSRVTL